MQDNDIHMAMLVVSAIMIIAAMRFKFKKTEDHQSVHKDSRPGFNPSIFIGEHIALDISKRLILLTHKGTLTETILDIDEIDDIEFLEADNGYEFSVWVQDAIAWTQPLESELEKALDTHGQTRDAVKRLQQELLALKPQIEVG